jgi:hypothetical protein
MDSFFARDIQRLFGFRDMNRFNALFEFILRQSGGRLGISQAAAALGLLWEHLVLEHLQAHLPGQPVQYWRDKAGNEVDFLVPPSSTPAHPRRFGTLEVSVCGLPGLDFPGPSYHQ